MVVDSFQLDNQLLETLRPVVLSPHEMPSGLLPGRIAKGARFNHQSLLRHVNALEARPLLSLQVRMCADTWWACPPDDNSGGLVSWCLVAVPPLLPHQVRG